MPEIKFVVQNVTVLNIAFTPEFSIIADISPFLNGWSPKKFQYDGRENR